MGAEAGQGIFKATGVASAGRSLSMPLSMAGGASQSALQPLPCGATEASGGAEEDAAEAVDDLFRRISTVQPELQSKTERHAIRV